jgi:hypothetical protein
MSIRDDLAESIDDLDVSDDLEQAPQEVITDETTPDETTPDETDNEEAAPNDDTASSDDNSGAAEGGESTSSAETDDNPNDAAPEPNKSTDSIKAPAGWKPADREQWSKVPRTLQETIMAREKEISDTMANTKTARDVNEYVDKMGQHFAPMIESAGFKHPLEAANAALGTMNVLASGTTQQKAQEIARIIGQFGVDIEMLDQAIVASPNSQAPVNPQDARIEQMLEARLKPFNEMMTQQQNTQLAEQQKKVEQATTAVQEFAGTAEFLNDVREDMADIIDIANKRGVDLSLQQAYDRACAAHPEISNVLAERRRNEEITGKQVSLAGKQEAGSSISGRKTGSGGGSTGLSLRGALEAAVDDAG